MASPRTQIMVVLFFSGAFMLFGLIGGAGTVAKMMDGRESLAWPTTTGEVVYSRPRRTPGANLKQLEYRYAVDGTSYLSTRAAFLRVPYSTPVHEIYDEGDEVTVWYDPAAPERSVLEPGTPLLGVIGGLIAPILLFGFGGMVAFYGLRR